MANARTIMPGFIPGEPPLDSTFIQTVVPVVSPESKVLSSVLFRTLGYRIVGSGAVTLDFTYPGPGSEIWTFSLSGTWIVPTYEGSPAVLPVETTPESETEFAHPDTRAKALRVKTGEPYGEYGQPIGSGTMWGSYSTPAGSFECHGDVGVTIKLAMPIEVDGKVEIYDDGELWRVLIGAVVTINCAYVILGPSGAPIVADRKCQAFLTRDEAAVVGSLKVAINDWSNGAALAQWDMPLKNVGLTEGMTATYDLSLSQQSSLRFAKNPDNSDAIWTAGGSLAVATPFNHPL